MKMDEMPEILTAQNIADYLRISRRMVYELLQLRPDAGGIPSFKIGASRRVKKESFLLWLDSKETK